MKIASIISYSSYHNAFIERVIEEAQKVSNEVIVVNYTHFFDGTKDDNLKQLSGVNQITIDNSANFDLGLDTLDARYFHNSGRLEGYKQLKGNYDAVFFIDSDEVLDGDRVKQWLKDVVELDEDYKLSHFWYFRDTCYRARTPEEGTVLVSRQTLESPEMEWFGDRERENYSARWHYMASYQNKVLGHHYSWAGTKEMLIKKVQSWGHNKDTNWEAMLEEEFGHPFNYTCPFKPYIFDKIEPYVGFTFNE